MNKYYIGMYTPSENFKTVPEHLCIANESNDEMIALIGPSSFSDEKDGQEMIDWAQGVAHGVLYTLAPKLFNAAMQNKTYRDMYGTGLGLEVRAICKEFLGRLSTADEDGKLSDENKEGLTDMVVNIILESFTKLDKQ